MKLGDNDAALILRDDDKTIEMIFPRRPDNEEVPRHMLALAAFGAALKDGSPLVDALIDELTQKMEPQ